jgi:hypothetical protein
LIFLERVFEKENILYGKSLSSKGVGHRFPRANAMAALTNQLYNAKNWLTIL